MFNGFFGTSEEDQLQFLEPRSMITIAVVAFSLILSIFIPGASGLIAVFMLFTWGWNVVRKWFGVTTFGALFSGNVVIGVVLLLAYLMMAYLAGIFFAILGVGRWIYLKIKYRKP